MRRLNTTEGGAANRLNRGHRLLDKRRWDDPIQATVDAVAEVPWQCHKQDRKKWKELEIRFVARMLRRQESGWAEVPTAELINAPGCSIEAICNSPRSVCIPRACHTFVCRQANVMRTRHEMTTARRRGRKRKPRRRALATLGKFLNACGRTALCALAWSQLVGSTYSHPRRTPRIGRRRRRGMRRGQVGRSEAARRGEGGARRRRCAARSAPPGATRLRRHEAGQHGTSLRIPLSLSRDGIFGFRLNSADAQILPLAANRLAIAFLSAGESARVRPSCRLTESACRLARICVWSDLGFQRQAKCREALLS